MRDRNYFNSVMVKADQINIQTDKDKILAHRKYETDVKNEYNIGNKKKTIQSWTSPSVDHGPKTTITSWRQCDS